MAPLARRQDEAGPMGSGVTETQIFQDEDNYERKLSQSTSAGLQIPEPALGS